MLYFPSSIQVWRLTWRSVNKLPVLCLLWLTCDCRGLPVPAVANLLALAYRCSLYFTCACHGTPLHGVVYPCLPWLTFACCGLPVLADITYFNRKGNRPPLVRVFPSRLENLTTSINFTLPSLRMKYFYVIREHENSSCPWDKKDSKKLRW